MLVLANRILAMEGLVGPYGHVSARSGADRFWIADHRSPDSVELSDLKAVSVGLDEAAARSQHWYREIFIHSEIYKELPEIGAVVHIHAPHSVALGTLAGSDRIRPTTNPGANLGQYIPIYGQTGLVESPENARKVASALQGQNGVLLRGHGAVIVGATLQQAVLRAIYLELEAHYQLMARAAGTPLFYTPEETARFSRTTAVEHAWEFYLEKLRRTGKSTSGPHQN
jgi:HCOMODA/2-hydroxy-3-carboxy-muconic semialdehyde decarboxylase